jgi:hypothetical protein
MARPFSAPSRTITNNAGGTQQSTVPAGASRLWLVLGDRELNRADEPVRRIPNVHCPSELF